MTPNIYGWLCGWYDFKPFIGISIFSSLKNFMMYVLQFYLHLMNGDSNGVTNLEKGMIYIPM